MLTITNYYPKYFNFYFNLHYFPSYNNLVWISNLDILGDFLLGFSLPCLYSHIPIVLYWELHKAL
jgi:hypothetical protein